MEEVSFDSLPFLFSDCERSLILEYKQKAVQKEQELVCRRRERIEQLRSYVKTRIASMEASKQFRDRRKIPPVGAEGAHEELPLHGERRVLPSEEKRTCQMGSCRLETKSGQFLTQHVVSDTRNVSSQSSLASSVLLTREHKKYTLVSAVAKGFLVRRLLHSEKVKQVTTTIQDTTAVLKSIERSGDQQDHALQLRVKAQLQVAKEKLHYIFFVVPVKQKMLYIAQSRQLKNKGKLKMVKLSTAHLSSATVKYLSRKKGDSGLKSVTTELKEIPKCK